MVIDNLPVIPCGLRPIMKLKEENVVASTQITNLKKKVILVSELLKKYLEYNKKKKVFTDEIMHNEKRRLQKVVDKLNYGSSLASAEFKSLLQNLSGKEGVLRRYSLGKRVDYSARSVIVPNPNLSLNQVGLPVQIARVLFYPFLLSRIKKEKMAFTVKEAERLLQTNSPKVFSLLNEVISDHPLIINRAPSLHRLSLQGFYPQLTLNKALELHPLVTTAFNADFDGDQMAVHLPLTPKACQEVRDYVLAGKQIIDPKNCSLIAVPSKDIILGIYYLTQEKKPSRLIFYDN
jgi:DNA-directed RNA polymerase subunit beta'